MPPKDLAKSTGSLVISSIISSSVKERYWQKSRILVILCRKSKTEFIKGTLIEKERERGTKMLQDPQQFSFWRLIEHVNLIPKQRTATQKGLLHVVFISTGRSLGFCPLIKRLLLLSDSTFELVNVRLTKFLKKVV